MTPAPEPRDLSTLTLAELQPLVGSVFCRANPPGADLELRLINAEPLSVSPHPDGTPVRQAFSLVFRGPHELVLSQGMHDLDHPTCPLPGVFLVPLAPDAEGPRYEAVFT